jgi:sn-glycerol 3-phosphate transport system substrate-binding protein
LFLPQRDGAAPALETSPMHRFALKRLAPIAAAAALFTSPAMAQMEIVWWHSMGGALGEWVNDVAKEFNNRQKDYKVTAVFKGTYDESMTAAIAAFRAGNAPHSRCLRSARRR